MILSAVSKTHISKDAVLGYLKGAGLKRPEEIRPGKLYKGDLKRRHGFADEGTPPPALGLTNQPPGTPACESAPR